MGLEEIANQESGVSKVRQFPKAIQRKQKVPLSQLINKLNRFNFKDEPILFNLKHRQHGHTISMLAHPQPCTDAELECYWVSEEEGNDQRLQAYDLSNFLLTDGQRLIEVEADLISINARQITVRLPEESVEAHSRIAKRYQCANISASVVANSAVYQGQLLDFNAFYLRILLTATPPQTFDWISGSIPMNLTLAEDNKVIYIGDCSVVRHTEGRNQREYVLKPSRSQFPRFRARENRSERQELLPNLNVTFTHPLTHKIISLKMMDLSGSGFALAEPYEEATLLPGMILKEVGIHLTSRSKLTCTAQVIHRTHNQETNMVRTGLAILDIDPLEHMELASLLQQARDPDTYISNHIDTDTLWDFFFETGFIYPQKYASLVNNKDSFRDVYDKLYTQLPEIARHFIHMEHNKILGHFAMLRLYDKTWCLHHHAALSGQRKSGLIVLDRLSNFVNDTHLIDSANTHYTAGFYRSTNKFPVKYFGGMTAYLNNPKASSIDDFAYLNFEPSPAHNEEEKDKQWEVLPARKGDLEDLRGFYENVSGGLLIDALDLTPEKLECQKLSETFTESGFKREVHRLSIKKNGVLKAILAVNCTDIGLNFSELNNAIHMFVVDGTGFNQKDFKSILTQVSQKYIISKFPVMVFPTAFMEKSHIPFEKTYCCNILNSQHWDDYMNYLRNFLKKAKVK